MKKPEYILYILIRNDLPSMNAGRACAHASHAANAFIHAFGKQKSVKKWQSETRQGFGTAIVLSATGEQISQIVNDGNTDFIFTECVYDPDYCIKVDSEILPYLDHSKIASVSLKEDNSKEDKVIVLRNEMTCGYIFGEKENVKNFVKDLQLYS